MVALKVALNLVEELGLTNQFIVTVTSKAANVKGTSAELLPGDILTLEELFYGLMLPSGNDASFVIAENLGMLAYLDEKI